MSLGLSTPDPTAGLDMFAEPEVARQLHRMSLDDYHRLGELGLISKQTELIRGVVVDKVTKSPLHSWLTLKLTDWLRSNLGDGWTVRSEAPLTLAPSESEPEPDISVVRGSIDDYFTSHPTTAALAIEIAISTESLDRKKALIYAESVFQEYWLFLPLRRQLVVHRQPSEGRYQSVTTLGPETTVSPEAFPDLVLELKDVLPVVPE